MCIYFFHIFDVVSIDGGISCISRVLNRRRLSLGCDISVCGLPHATRKGIGAVDHRQVRYTQIALRLYHVVPIKPRRKVRIFFFNLKYFLLLFYTRRYTDFLYTYIEFWCYFDFRQNVWCGNLSVLGFLIGPFLQPNHFFMHNVKSINLFVLMLNLHINVMKY